MTRNADDTNQKSKNENDKRYYDVSFDYPDEDSLIPSSRHSHPMPSERDAQAEEAQKKLYDKYMRSKENTSSTEQKEPKLAPDNQKQRDEWQFDAGTNETITDKSSRMVSHSFKKMKSLFSNLGDTKESNYNPYKDDSIDNRSGDLFQEAHPKVHRHASRRKNIASPQEESSVRERFANATQKEKTKSATSKKLDMATQINTDASVPSEPTDVPIPAPFQPVYKRLEDVSLLSNTAHDILARTATQTTKDDTRLSHSPLPSPREIAKERERRRKLRIDQLENLYSDEDISRTHESHFRPITRSNSDTKKLEREGKYNTIIHEKVERPFIAPLNEAPIPESLQAQTILEDTTSVMNEDFADIVKSETPVEEITVSESLSEIDDIIVEPLETEEINDNSVEVTSVEHDSDNDRSDSEDIQNDTPVSLNSESYLEFEVTPISSITDDPADEDKILTDIHSEESPIIIENLLEDDEITSSEYVEPQAAEQSDISDTPTSTKKTSWFKRKKDATKEAQYKLTNYTSKERILFGLNVAFNVVKRLALYIILMGLLLGAAGAGAGIGYFAHLVSETPPPSREEMAAKINKLEQLSTIYYANGEPIANVQADVVRSITQLNDISPFIVDGIIATEDEYFYQHSGVMPKAILRAALQSIISSGTATGGSTLTQQLVKQQLLTNDVTFFRKANEILLALRLENFFSKDEILTAYLNVSPFGRNNSGENVAGIAKASEGVFGKKPSEVNLPQAAFLVGLPQNPYGYTPYDQNGNLRADHTSGLNRMKDVLFRMRKTQKITEEQYQEALAYDITQDFLPTSPKSPERQSYLYHAMMQGAIEQIMRQNIAKDNLTWNQVYVDDNWYNEYYTAAEQQLKTGGYKVYTTIDKQIYDQLQVSAKQYIGDLGVGYEGIYVDPTTGQETTYLETVQNGFVVMDNTTGKVLGFVSGTDYDRNQIDHAFSMRRSPGSTIKPLAVYGPAIEENLITPATMIPDTEFVQVFEDGTTWTPTNYGNVISGGNESARVALYKSDNLPAIRVYQELLNRHVDVGGYLEKMGFNTVMSYTKDDIQNLAFSIGGVSQGPTVFEETRAFATFANNGQYVNGYYIERIEDSFGNIVFQHEAVPTQVFSEDSNYLMVDMLRDTMTDGTARIAQGYLEFGGDWIAKTGISENSKDVWMIASTPSITIGSWIGYDSKYQNYTINIDDGYGRESERSQLYWARMVNDLYRIRPEIFGIERVFEQPATVQTTAVLQATGTLPGTITLENGSLPISGPLYEDLFKISHPAPALSYNVLFNATTEELARFWATYRTQLEELRRQQLQQQQQQQSNSSSSSQSENSSSDESSSQSSESNPNGTGQ